METYLLKISAQTNYISRVTRSIMLGDDFEANMRAFDERASLVTEHFTKVREAAAKIRDPAKQEHFRTLIQQAQTQTTEFIKDGRDKVSVLKEHSAADKAAAWPAYHKTATPLANKARASFKELVDYSTVTLKESKEQVNAAIGLLLVLLPIGAGVMIVATVISGYLIIKKLLQQLGGEPEIAVHVARQIAAGNLSTPIDVPADDDASLLRAMQNMQASLSQTILQICRDAEKVAQMANASNAEAENLVGISVQLGTLASSLREHVRHFQVGDR